MSARTVLEAHSPIQPGLHAFHATIARRVLLDPPTTRTEARVSSVQTASHRTTTRSAVMTVVQVTLEQVGSVPRALQARVLLEVCLAKRLVYHVAIPLQISRVFRARRVKICTPAPQETHALNVKLAPSRTTHELHAYLAKRTATTMLTSGPQGHSIPTQTPACAHSAHLAVNRTPRTLHVTHASCSTRLTVESVSTARQDRKHRQVLLLHHRRRLRVLIVPHTGLLTCPLGRTRPVPPVHQGLNRTPNGLAALPVAQAKPALAAKNVWHAPLEASLELTGADVSCAWELAPTNIAPMVLHVQHAQLATSLWKREVAVKCALLLDLATTLRLALPVRSAPLARSQTRRWTGAPTVCLLRTASSSVQTADSAHGVRKGLSPTPRVRRVTLVLGSTL